MVRGKKRREYQLSFYGTIIFTSVFNIINLDMLVFSINPIHDAIITYPHPAKSP
jgi:hypothetical protein